MIQTMKILTPLNQKIIAVILLITGLALPTTTYLLTRPQNPQSRASTLSSIPSSKPTPFPTGALGLKWLTFESEEFNFTHKFSKCMRPYTYQPPVTPPYHGVAGWTYRCEDGRAKMEVIVTDMGLSEALQTYPSSGELEFKKYQNEYYSGWKGEIPGQIVYYILERLNEKNIWVIGYLDQFVPDDTPGHQPTELIAEVVETLKPLR